MASFYFIESTTIRSHTKLEIFIFPRIFLAEGCQTYKQENFCRLFSPDLLKITVRSRGVTQQMFIRGGSAPRSNPFNTLLYTIFHEKGTSFVIPSIDRWYPFHIPCLELCIPFNCCKCIVFK